ncbi:MAG TPA: NTP transferase domain-containing protein [Clostridiaceae bacterium]|nr:NTP transferase domain-containing protein [Clostridiaceae bacterium]
MAPTLVILAAGMGSRYGGLKQLDPVGPDGEIMMEYSIYDAVRAGFDSVIFVIRKDFEKEFDDLIGRKLKGHVRYSYAFQELDDLPPGYVVPDGRVKPWGTGHALLAAAPLINGPLAVINADDYYGSSAYEKLYRFLTDETDGVGDERYGICLWPLHETLSDYGSVSRGVSEITADSNLIKITELKKVFRDGDGARYTLDDGATFHPLARDTLVSMNFFGFPQKFLSRLGEEFAAFLEEGLVADPLKCEYLLPEIVGDHTRTRGVTVRAIPVEDRWFGVTNREDKPIVVAALQDLVDQGVYPAPLWGRRD